MRVLVVEDHPKLATTVGTVLRREGMAVDVVFDGHEALDHITPSRTTWLCWTVISPGFTATTYVGVSWPAVATPGY